MVWNDPIYTIINTARGVAATYEQWTAALTAICTHKLQDHTGGIDDDPAMNVTTTHPGLCPKLDNNINHFLRSDGIQAAPPGSGGVGGATGSVDSALILADGVVGDTIKGSGITVATTLGTDDTTVPTSKAVISALPNRNLIINGDCRVNQRVTAYTLVKDVYTWDADDLTGPDRHEGMATGTAVSAGTWGQSTTCTAGNSGYGFKFAGVTLTGTGILYHRHRIEARDATRFKNMIASFSVKVYHDVGSNVNYTIYVRTANAADNFSAVTAISNSGAISVPPTTATTLKFENISMGDCSNGIEIEIKIECGAVTLKNFCQTELQLELGSVATAFEYRSYSSELSLCRWRTRTFNSAGNVWGIIGAGMCASTTTAFILIPVNMSSVPTITQRGNLCAYTAAYSYRSISAVSIEVDWATKDTILIRVTSTDLVAGNQTQLGAQNDATGDIILSTEL